MSASGVRRDLRAERRMLRNAARPALADPERLIEHAEQRSLDGALEYVPDPMVLAEGRDWALDLREELADAVNYGRWWLAANPDHPKAGERRHALGLIARAYQAWED